jgi:hypothetical protein
MYDYKIPQDQVNFVKEVWAITGKRKRVVVMLLIAFFGTPSLLAAVMIVEKVLGL